MAGYNPTTQGGAEPASNPYSTQKAAFGGGDFEVVTAPTGGGRHPFAHEPMAGDPHDPVKSSANDMISSLLTMSTPQVLQLQDKLIAAGLLPKSGRTGTADLSTQKAYADLLTETFQYNRQGVNQTADDLLATKAKSLAEAGVGDSTQGRIYSPQDPATIKQALQSIAAESMGKKKLPPAVIEKFTSYFHGLQQAAFNASKAAENGGTATVTSPDLGAQAQQFIDSNFATEEASHDIVGYMGALRGLLGGG